MSFEPQSFRSRGSDCADLEGCYCGTLMTTQLGGEELLCGSCNVDQDQDTRDDATQARDDGYKVMHGGDGGAKEKTVCLKS